ncbi:MAG TPA: hypothetical protein ENI85_03110 [Deltaproteobacteria bacterium]|nr:hypothetical protein [Deltaproteobacteria bacterium]
MDSAPVLSPRSSDVERAIERAIAYLNDPELLDEHFVFYVLDFLERRFALHVWQSMPDRYASFLASSDVEDSQKEVFRRLIEPGYIAPMKQLEAVEDPVDRITTRALYCRDYPLPADYEGMLRKRAIGGGYHQSHVAMAIQWLKENGCSPYPEEIESYVVDLMAVGIDAHDRLSDLEIERAAFLGYLGRADRAPPDLVRELVRLQNADGGWAIRPGGPSNWHPTFLALWILLESEGRSNGAPMITPRGE